MMIKRENFTDEIAEILQRKILEMNLKDGDRLPSHERQIRGQIFNLDKSPSRLVIMNYRNSGQGNFITGEDWTFSS